ncbi:MAG: sulfatase-like hydrolase/transferase [Planctomycetota bacterium]
MRPWSELTADQRKQLDYRMAVYAAMVDRMDQNIGRVVKWLEDQQQLDNTLLLFLSDNGGCAEPYKDLGGGKFVDINNPETSGAISYGQGWANASNTPFRKFKVFSHEGGISTPLIVHWPNGLKTGDGAITQTPAQLIDVMPTVLDATGASYPDAFADHQIHPLQGVSFMPTLAGKKREPAKWMYWEHAGHKAVRHGDFKALLPRREKAWALYNLSEDRQELNNLVGDDINGKSEFKQLVTHMANKWYEWAKSHGVSDKQPKKPRKSKRKKTTLKNEKSSVPHSEIVSDKGNAVRQRLRRAIRRHDRAVQLFDEKIRDPFVMRGPDGHFYLTGTTAGTHWGDSVGIQLWKSKNLVDWENKGLVWNLNQDGKSQTSWHFDRPTKSGVKNGRAIWAPELHFLNGSWWVPHSLNISGHGLLKSESDKPVGPYIALPAIAGHGIDAHLYQEKNRTFYLWGSDNLVELSHDLAKPIGDVVKLRPSGNHELGYEGIWLNRVGNKYLLMASGRYGYELSDTYDVDFPSRIR